MRTPWIAGPALAVTAGLLVAVGGGSSAELTTTALLGAALGAALGLVPGEGYGGRLGAWVAGFVLAWFGYLIRAAALPDTSAGRALAAIVVVLALAVVCGIARDRLPLWAGLLGVAALVGAYELTFSSDPTRFTTDSTAAATTVAVAAALGFLVAGVVGALVPPADAAGTRAYPPADGGDAGWAEGGYPAPHDHHAGDPVAGVTQAASGGASHQGQRTGTGEAALRLGGKDSSNASNPPKGQA